jgi:hypothetical protein
MMRRDSNPDWDGPDGRPKEASEGPALRRRTGEDLWTMEPPARELLLGPWLGAAEAVMVWAPTGAGKSMFVLTLALALASGGAAFGWSASEARRVLLVDGEMPLGDTVRRMRDLSATVEGFDLEAAKAGLQVISRLDQPLDAPEDAFPDFGADPMGAADRVLSGWKPNVVILDNLSTIAGFSDENGAADTRAVNRFIARFKQRGVAVVVVHHSDKAGQRFRGSTMIATSFDTILGLTRDTAEATTGGAEFTFAWNKVRAMRDESMRGFKVTLETGPDGRLRWIMRDPSAGLLAALVAEVRTEAHESLEDAAAAIDADLWPNGRCPDKTGISRAFKRAEEAGLATRGDLKAICHRVKRTVAILSDREDGL